MGAPRAPGTRDDGLAGAACRPRADHGGCRSRSGCVGRRDRAGAIRHGGRRDCRVRFDRKQGRQPWCLTARRRRRRVCGRRLRGDCERARACCVPSRPRAGRDRRGLSALGRICGHRGLSARAPCLGDRLGRGRERARLDRRRAGRRHGCGPELVADLPKRSPQSSRSRRLSPRAPPTRRRARRQPRSSERSSRTGPRGAGWWPRSPRTGRGRRC